MLTLSLMNKLLHHSGNAVSYDYYFHCCNNTASYESVSENQFGVCVRTYGGSLANSEPAILACGCLNK